MMSATLDTSLELPDLNQNIAVGDMGVWGRFVKLICEKHGIPYNEPQGKNSCHALVSLTFDQAPAQKGTWPVFTLRTDYAIKLFPKWGSDHHQGDEGFVVWDREVKSYNVLKDAPRDIGTLIPWEGNL